MESTLSQRVGQHLRSNVVGYLALFIALTIAPAIAATKVAPRNSVTSRSIKDGQVKTADIGDGQVSGADIADGQVTAADIGDAQVGAADLATGALDWNALSNVPAGLADGDDADSGGTVTEVTTGAGMSGGPITKSGAVALASCPNGQLLKSTGSDYACANDVDTNSGGDITGVSTSAFGLTGGATSGNVNLALATCGLNEVLQSNGSSYSCKANALGVTAVFGATPSVAGLTVATVNLAAGAPITNLTGGVGGQVVTLVNNGSTTIHNDGDTFGLSSDWAGGPTDTLTLARTAGIPEWVEVARSNNN